VRNAFLNNSCIMVFKERKKKKTILKWEKGRRGTCMPIKKDKTRLCTKLHTSILRIREKALEFVEKRGKKGGKLEASKVLQKLQKTNTPGLYSADFVMRATGEGNRGDGGRRKGKRGCFRRRGLVPIEGGRERLRRRAISEQTPQGVL